MNLIEEFTKKKKNEVPCVGVGCCKVAKKTSTNLVRSSEGSKKRSGGDIGCWT